jgi:hypothetical protein
MVALSDVCPSRLESPSLSVVRRSACACSNENQIRHNSKAIHRAYAKKAIIIAPSLEEYEAKAAAQPNAVTV